MDINDTWPTRKGLDEMEVDSYKRKEVSLSATPLLDVNLETESVNQYLKPPFLMSRRYEYVLYN